MKESINLYRLLLLLFLVLCTFLSYVDFNLYKGMKAADTVSSSIIYNVKNTENKKHGYSDILKLLNLDENIELLEFKNSLDRNGLVSIDMKYHGSLESLYSTLERMKRENFFVTIEKIEVQNTLESDKDISLTALFMKDI